CASGADCPAAKPVCEASHCRLCQNHDDCPSHACVLPEGRCAMADELIYVAPPPVCQAGGPGTGASPYCTLSSALGVVPAKKRSFIYVRKGIYHDNPNSSDEKTFDVIAEPGTTLVPSVSSFLPV